MNQTLRANKQQDFRPVSARIVSVDQVTEMEKLFTLELPVGVSLGHKPMQFVMLSLFGIGEAPISITSSPDDSCRFELCVRNAGLLTGHLHGMKAGDTVGIRGPFGNGFPVEVLPDRDILFVAGGLGLAPLRSLINDTIARRDEVGKIHILYGCKRPDERLFTDELEAWQQDDDIEFHQTVDVATEGWTGNVGVITTLFRRLRLDPANTVPVVCGPPVMYKFVLLELLSRGIPESRIFMSLERRMRCGLGKCGHCQINGVYVCQDGPVFNYIDAKRFKEAL